MILNSCSPSSGALHLFPCNRKMRTSMFFDSRISCSPSLTSMFFNSRISCRGNSWIPPPISKLNLSTSLGIQLSSLSVLVLYKQKRNSNLCPKASMDNNPFDYRHPAMTKKPRWWRTLACIPYLIPLHSTFIYAETVYHLHPFLEAFEFCTLPFWRSLSKLPQWFMIAYWFAAYLGIVKRKEWPHFLRFHVVNGFLLEVSFQVIGNLSSWMPRSVYWGKIGMHFWTAISFGYLFTVLECVRCALAGMYADIPFVCDAAYIQVTYD